MAIAFENVDFSYDGQRKVLDNFSLTLPERGVLCLFGPSGCGKTTLLRLLAGMDLPHGGRIVGLEKLRVAVVFQENRLLPWETVLGNVAIVTEEVGRSARLPSLKPTASAYVQATKWLSYMGLGDVLQKYPDELSGGMKRRVAIARALAAPADLLILDEPFVGLEQELWTAIAREVKSVYANRPVMLVTHNLEQAEIMNAQVIHLSGPPLFNHPEGKRV